MTSILERRRIEALFAKAMLAELEKHLPREQALSILRDAVIAMARGAGQGMAASQAAAGQAPDLVGLARIIPLWQQDDALDIDWRERTPTRLAFDVTRCRYAEMYRELGIPELGAVLSCNRDGEFCGGYNPAIELSRPHTLMQGAPCCDFHYTLRSDPAHG